ncbi:MAG TPA: hypothetical protein VM182_12375 [Terriglobia bacterium]|nr:hypothetical protein [Terriglobia bacterium]
MPSLRRLGRVEFVLRPVDLLVGVDGVEQLVVDRRQACAAGKLLQLRSVPVASSPVEAGQPGAERSLFLRELVERLGPVEGVDAARAGQRIAVVAEVRFDAGRFVCEPEREFDVGGCLPGS